MCGHQWYSGGTVHDCTEKSDHSGDHVCGRCYATKKK